MAQTGNREELRQSGEVDIRNYLLVLNLRLCDCSDTHISSALYLISSGRLTSADQSHDHCVINTRETHPDKVR